MNQIACPGCRQVYPVPPNLPPTTPFTCQKCGHSSQLGVLLQQTQAAMAAPPPQPPMAQPGLAATPTPEAQRPLANMPVVNPSGVPSGGLDPSDGPGALGGAPPPAAPPSNQGGSGFAVIQPTRSKTDQYGNRLPDIDVVCPKCKNPSKVPPDTDMEFQFVCQKCRHSDRLGNVLLGDLDEPKKQKKTSTGDFYEDVPEELRRARPEDQLREKALKRDPRLPAIGAAVGLLLLIGIPLFGSGGNEEVDPRLARQGLVQKKDNTVKYAIFGTVVVGVVAGLFFLLKPQRDEEEEEEYEEEEAVEEA